MKDRKYCTFNNINRINIQINDYNRLYVVKTCSMYFWENILRKTLHEILLRKEQLYIERNVIFRIKIQCYKTLNTCKMHEK